MAFSMALKAAELIKARKDAEVELQQQCAKQGLSLKAEELAEIAQELARAQIIANEAHLNGKTTKAFQNMTKYTGDLSAATYLQIFEDECKLMGIVLESDKMKVFPSLVNGPRAQHVQTELRQLGTWQEIQTKFLELFEVSKEVVLADLRSLYVKDYDVDSYNDAFNKAMCKYPFTSSDESVLKEAYVSSLPYKTREKMKVDRNLTVMKLSEAMKEALRTHKALNEFNRSKENNNWGNQNKNKERKDQANLSVIDLFNRMHITNPNQHNQCEDTFGSFCDQLVYQVDSIRVKENLTDDEQFILKGVEQSLKDHLVREIGNKKGRFSQKDFLTEVERILSKAQSGMSLYERLLRDPLLRADLSDLLKEMDNVKTAKALGPLQKRFREEDDDKMIQSVTMAATNTSNTSNTSNTLKYSEHEQKVFADYYGAHPSLLDGFDYFSNSEKQQFVSKLTQTDRDITPKQPVVSNVPQVNVVVSDGKGSYKVRAIVDSGSTTTILSSGMLELMPELQYLLKPTSLTFFGVGEQRMRYTGMLYELQMQLTDSITLKSTVAVYEQKQPVMLIGQDIMGGKNGKLRVLGMNTDLAFFCVVDQNNKTGLVHYMKNIEASLLPPAPINATSIENSVTQLFRR